MPTERELSYNPASMAVADAMMLAQASLLNVDKFFQSSDGEDMDEAERRIHRYQMTMELTWRKCVAGVEVVIDHLGRKHRDKFDSVTVLVANEIISPFIQPWGKHYYFLARDLHSGVWHAGSPANHINTDRESRLTSPIMGTDLDEVLSQITNRERGKWPDSSYITNLASDPRFALPTIFVDPYTNQPQTVATAITNLGECNWHYAFPVSPP